MALAIDKIHGRGCSNKMCPQLTAKEDYGKAILAINIAAKGILCTVHSFLRNLTDTFSMGQ